MNPGKIILLNNAKTDLLQGHLVLTIDKYGRVNFKAAERVNKSIDNVNESRDVSAAKEEQTVDRANSTGILLKKPRC